MFGDMFHPLIPGCEDVLTESTILWPIGGAILELTSSGSCAGIEYVWMALSNMV
jgi:hypothetical protein